jgi:DNA repair exonuclease SbcCD ATPase subunit
MEEGKQEAVELMKKLHGKETEIKELQLKIEIMDKNQAGLKDKAAEVDTLQAEVKRLISKDKDNARKFEEAMEIRDKNLNDLEMDKQKLKVQLQRAEKLLNDPNRKTSVSGAGGGGVVPTEELKSATAELERLKAAVRHLKKSHAQQATADAFKLSQLLPALPAAAVHVAPDAYNLTPVKETTEEKNTDPQQRVIEVLESINHLNKEIRVLAAAPKIVSLASSTAPQQQWQANRAQLNILQQKAEELKAKVQSMLSEVVSGSTVTSKFGTFSQPYLSQALSKVDEKSATVSRMRIQQGGSTANTVKVPVSAHQFSTLHSFLVSSA